MGGKLLILGLLIAGGGAVSVALGYSIQRRDEVLKKWPSVPGTIVSRSIVKTTIARLRVPSTHGGASPEPTYREDPVWAIEVDYNYSLDGKTYGGRNATSARLLENVRRGLAVPSSKMQAIAAQLSPGGPATVHYDPADRAKSYLVMIDDPGKASLFRTGGICVIAGLLLAAAGRLV